MAAPPAPMPAAAAHAAALAAIPGNPGHPAGLPDARAGYGIWGMRKLGNFGPAAGPNPEGYYQPGLPPPLAIPGAANPLELYGGGLANSTGTQPPTGVPFGAHPLKQLNLQGREHVATVVLRFYHYPPPALPPNAPMTSAALAGLPTRLVWQVRVLDPFLQNPRPAAWQGCVAWAPALDGAHAAMAAAAAAGAGLGAAAGPLAPGALPWQHRCVVQQQQPLATGGSGWVDVGHINVAETGNGCWDSNGKCPLDTLAGYPAVGTDAYRAPGMVLGLLRNFVGAQGFPPLLCAAGAANALRYTVEYDPGHFCEENAYESHVHMRIFAPAGMAHPAHAGAQPAPALSPFHDALLHVLRLRNAPPPPAGGLANLPPAQAAALAGPLAGPLPVPPAGHDPFWRYVYYMH